MGLMQLGLVGEFEDGQGGRVCEALSAAGGLLDPIPTAAFIGL